MHDTLSLPPRPLPRPVTPFPDETLQSYLDRLADANQLKQRHLRDELTDQPGRISVPRLATTSGQPERTLRYAILELCTDEELATMNISARPKPIKRTVPARRRSSRQGHPACRFCALARGITEPVWTHRPLENLICRRHRRWIGAPTGHTTIEQPDLAAAPEILQANNRHRRLIRRHGRATVNHAFTTANRICRSWRLRVRDERHDHDYRRLLHALTGCPDPHAPPAHHNPITDAAAYPQVIALTRLLASPHWQTLALRDHLGQDLFLTEIRRTVAPGYISRWNPYRRDQLVYWAEQLQQHPAQAPAAPFEKLRQNK